MKRIISAVPFTLLAINTILQAEDAPRRMELTLNGTFGSVKQSTTTAGQTHDGEATSYGILSIRPGFLLGSRVALEPEILLTVFENREPSFFFVGNFSFTFSPGTTTPFISAGYGIGNSIPHRVHDTYLMLLSETGTISGSHN